MEFFARHPILRRAVALILATILPSACMTWRPVLGPQSYVAAEGQSHVRAGLSGGQVVDLYNAMLIGDNLVGYREKGVDTSRVAIPRSQIKYVEVRDTDVGGTVLMGVTIGVALLFAIGLATYQGFRGSKWLQMPE